MGELRIQHFDLATPSHVSMLRPPELGDLQGPPAAALLPRPGTGVRTGLLVDHQIGFGNYGNTIEKPWDNGGFMGTNGIYPLVI